MVATQKHKESNYFAIGGPPLDQKYVYHSDRQWTTDGLTVASLTIVLCNKIQNNNFWKVIHLNQLNLRQDGLFSGSVKTNAVQQSLRCSHQRTTIGPPTMYSSYRSRMHVSDKKKICNSFRFYQKTKLEKGFCWQKRSGPDEKVRSNV